MTKTQILGKLRRRDGCGNREEVGPTMPNDDDYDWADDETLSAEETMRIFEALGPDVPITGPPNTAGEHIVPSELTFAYATTKTEAIITPVMAPLVAERESVAAHTA